MSRFRDIHLQIGCFVSIVLSLQMLFSEKCAEIADLISNILFIYSRKNMWSISDTLSTVNENKQGHAKKFTYVDVGTYWMQEKRAELNPIT